ncbi:hypothetical protein HY643_02005 [Candidatus Woesearchaeota archaeon]|nr:hypothetical protein [Candidatus Woesearchaeota archaeon]
MVNWVKIIGVFLVGTVGGTIGLTYLAIKNQADYIRENTFTSTATVKKVEADCAFFGKGIDLKISMPTKETKILSINPNSERQCIQYKLLLEEEKEIEFRGYPDRYDKMIIHSTDLKIKE